MSEGKDSGSGVDQANFDVMAPELALKKDFKSSGEMARSLGFSYDKPNSSPIDLRYLKPLVVPQGVGVEGLLVDTGTFSPEQGFALEASLGPLPWSIKTDLLNGSFLKQDDLERLGLASHISNNRLPFEMLRAGGYRKVAAAVREVEQSGILSQQLAELLKENVFGHQFIPDIIARFKKQFPQYGSILDMYDEHRALYFIGEPTRGRKSLPILEVGIGANGIRILPTVALPSADPGKLIDVYKIKRYDSKLGYLNASWITQGDNLYEVGDNGKARDVLEKAIATTSSVLASKGK